MHQVQQHWAKAMFSGGGGGDKSWYGVRGGPNPGVCSSWDAARKLSHGVSGARVKKFATEAEARAFARVLTPTQASEALLLAAAAAAHVSEGGLAGSEGALAGLQPTLPLKRRRLLLPPLPWRRSSSARSSSSHSLRSQHGQRRTQSL